ncbi:pilus assembly protein [Herbaspirillum seropedicae]|uniref:pilus assembly protein n=1 Tax=Herbaspirillum seropedicae TaxID=964 RepID=UPI00111CE5DE|nr:pilus assembly protein [Herbaspirillum seropedicae]QDD65954.1 pilus assembly protein [Herbaspirillum seropedicae]
MKPTRQRGATLMIALTLLSLILLLGAAATSLLLLSEQAARNHAEHAQAHLAAQAALDDACLDLRQGRAPSKDAAAPQAGCRHDPAGAGWCLGRAHRSAWQSAQLHGAQAISAQYGQFTGRRFPALPGVSPPRYLIEQLTDGAADTTTALYRLNAIGYGRDGAQVALQALVRHPDPHAAPASCRSLAWRTLFLPDME